MIQNPQQRSLILVGRVGSVYGVRGWLKIYSDTDPKENIIKYQPWQLNHADNWETVIIKQSRLHGNQILVQFEGCDQREQAQEYTNAIIYIYRKQLPALAHNEYYWSDLQGLTVITTTGVTLGKVTQLLETGANDVLIVQGDKERLIPYIPHQVIVNIDIAKKMIEVDWDPEF